MSKPKIMRKSLNCQLNGTVWAMLNDYCEESGLSKTVATEQAIKMYIKSNINAYSENAPWLIDE